MTTRPDPHPALAGPWAGHLERTGVLLLILVFTYLLSAFTKGVLVSTIQVVLFLAVVLIVAAQRPAAAAGPCGSSRSWLLARVGRGRGAPGWLDKNGPGAGVANMWTALILLLSAVLIVRRVLSRPEITLQSIYGAISAYMILGPDVRRGVRGDVPLRREHRSSRTGRRAIPRHFQYFSFTTLTTLGYGDYTAAARAAARRSP